MTKKATRVQKTVKVAPSKVGFWDTTVGKTARAALYLAVSAALSSVITDITNNPNLFGVLTPLINIGLVAVKNLANSNVKNI